MSDTPTRPIRMRGEPASPPPASTVNVDEEIKKLRAEEAERKLVTFVEDQISKMRDSLHLSSGHEPTFYEVNEALVTYQDTNLGLLALHNTAKLENTKAKEAFDDWFAGKFIEIRDRVNPRNLSAQKWYSQKEIEMMVRKEYSDEFNKYNWDLIATEHQLAFLRRLLETWASQQYVLTQLSKNLIAEMNGLGVEDALNRASESTNVN